MMLALFFGAAFGVAIAMLRHALKQGVEDPELIERALGLPLYATVPESQRQTQMNRKAGARENIGVLSVLDTQDPTVESIRSLRTSIQFAASQTGHTVVLITGPSPDVGKSFIATNLAAVLGQLGGKVLIVDADMRRGHTYRYWGGRKKPGLSEVLSGQIDFETALQRDVAAGVDLLSNGEHPPNPAELLINPRMLELLANLREKYQWVVIDTPPVLAVTDATILGQHSDAVLMVVRSGAHSLREIAHATRRIEQAGVRVKGVVFNGTPVHGAYGYGYGYQYGYTYHYKSKKD